MTGNSTKPLERAAGPCDGAAMSQPSPTAGGFFLILAIIVGLAIGVALGQPMIGVVGGTALGTVIALLVWWRDRRRAP